MVSILYSFHISVLSFPNFKILINTGLNVVEVVDDIQVQVAETLGLVNSYET